MVEYVDESGNAIEGAPETIELGKISDHSELNISDKDYEFKSAKVNDADCSFVRNKEKRERGEHLCSLPIQRIMQSGLSVIWQ